ncbi:hypothetical protein CPB86DRAFT_711647, partial [Serendipita vermifera]
YSQCQPDGSSSISPTATISSSSSRTDTSVGTLPTSTSLGVRFKSKGKKYWGAFIRSATMSSSAGSLLKSQCKSISSPEAILMLKVPFRVCTFNFATADTIINYAQTNEAFTLVETRGYTFVWHSQLPSWVTSISDASTLTYVIQSHITTIGTRYKGKIVAWDVCNEVFLQDGSIRVSVFYAVLADNFVSIAFKAARAVDSIPKLYINVAHNQERIIGRVRAWTAAGVPIDGIGSQMHLPAGRSSGVLAALTALAGSGVSELAITDLEIGQAGSNDYVTVVKACLALTACVSITSAGIADGDPDLTLPTPLLFNTNYLPKPAYTAVMNELA